MSKAEILFDAVTGIRPELVEEAQNYRFRRRSLWRRVRPYMAAVACLALGLAVGWNALHFGGMGGGNMSGGATGGSAPTDPGDSGAAGDMAPPAQGAGDGGSAPADDAGDAEDGAESAVSTVLVSVAEVRADGWLVEVLSGDEELLGQTFLLPAAEAAATPGLAAGDLADVTWSGGIDWDSQPPALLGESTIETVQP